MNSTVSIIVPCYNEHATIGTLLDGILAQTYPRGRLEVLIADGMSTDGTRTAIAEYQTEHPDLSIRIVDNRAGSIPAALNRAMRAAGGEVIVRLDAHCMPYPEYVERCVRALAEQRGLNVGGVWEIQPGARTWVAQAVAIAAAHPLGAGDAQYRLRPKAGEVDTVPFGAFRRSLIDQIGPFDETLLANEDYEFNTRVRKAGGKVWLDPGIRSVYYARPTLGALARQYWRYGNWKWRMLRRYPTSIRWRQALPPLFVFSLAALALLAIVFEAARTALLVEAGAYLAVVFLAGIVAAITRRRLSLSLGLPLAIATMHLAWGGGFLRSMLASVGESE